MPITVGFLGRGINYLKRGAGVSGVSSTGGDEEHFSEGVA